MKPSWDRRRTFGNGGWERLGEIGKMLKAEIGKRLKAEIGRMLKAKIGKMLRIEKTIHGNKCKIKNFSLSHTTPIKVFIIKKQNNQCL